MKISRCSEKSCSRVAKGSGIYVKMRVLLYATCLLWMLATRAQTKPQITKLFPVEELVNYHQQQQQQQSANETKTLDKFLGKLRATYDFVFREPENTSNVERILARNEPSPDGEKLRAIWSPAGNRGKIDFRTNDYRPSLADDEWFANEAEPLSALELLNETGDEPDRDVETLDEPDRPTTFRLPAAIGRQLLQWLTSLLGLTYGLYAKLSTAVHDKYNATLAASAL